MASKPTLSQAVHDRIHFDTLLEQVEQVVRAYASETWSDLAEHDPGITLLQALSYGVSDLAYRHTLPLVDLLTPEPEKGGIFSEKFVPEHMLTSGPITKDDYRRALLDLHSSDDTKNKDKYSYHDFYFRNVQLTPEPEEKRYRYGYDSKKREFLLIGPTSAMSKLYDAANDDVKQQVVLGGFNLYVELNLGMTKERAEEPLKNFLQEHRNLCEEVREIIWVTLDTTSLFRADIELEDDCQNPEEVMAQVLTKAQAMVCPIAQHLTVNALTEQGQRNEAIYQGPQLKHGWIPLLPKERDYSKNLQITISPLVNQLLEIDGIKRIQKLGFGEKSDSVEVKWECVIPAEMCPQIWQGKTFNNASEINVLSEQVILLKRGQRVKPSAKDILKHIDSMRRPLINLQSAPPLRGRRRKPGYYHKASQYLPPCYGLQEPNPNPKQVQLRQFLLPFEQQLADGCEQLALLPALLAFERGGENNDGIDARVWGSHLEFIRSEEDVNDDLIKFLKDKAQDRDKERAIINYLLGYFGTPPISKVLLKEGDESEEVNAQNFLSIQRGYLARQGELGYRRACIQVNAVSALQRRIAARLGVGAALFKKTPDLSNLPFYVVEHRALLPKQPPDSKNGESEWRDSKITPDAARSSITIEMAVSPKFKSGEYINLIADINFFIGVKIENVSDDEKKIQVNLNDHEQLEAYIHKTTNANIEKLEESEEKARIQKCDDVMNVALSDDKEKLIITLKEEQKKLDFEVGQLIDLQIKSHTVFRLNIREVNQDKNEITFYLNDSMQLKNMLGSIDKIKKEDVHLHQSIIWLKDKSHQIKFQVEKSQQWIVSDIYPFPLKQGDKIDIVPKDPGEHEFEAEVEEVNPAKSAFTVKSEGREIRAGQDIFYFKSNEIKDRFSFSISVVFNRIWLKGVVDPHSTMEWVRKIVSEEIPCHLSAQIHWLEKDLFVNFGEAYGKWQNGGAPGWGEPSYQLLAYLSLGELPAPVKGIGMMMISTPDSQERNRFANPDGSAKPEWDDKEVEKTGLFYVPSRTT